MIRAAAILVAAGAVACAAAEPGERAAEVAIRNDVLAGLSFTPAFENFDSEGGRVVDGFLHGGSTEVKKNYIRLTPDRAVRRRFRLPRLSWRRVQRARLPPRDAWLWHVPGHGAALGPAVALPASANASPATFPFRAHRRASAGSSGAGSSSIRMSSR